MLFFLQETWLPHFSESSLSTDYADYNYHLSCDDMFTNAEDRLTTSDHVWHGTAIAWHRELHSLIKPLKVVNERFAGIRIKCDKMSVVAISLYLPTSGKDDEFSECLSSLSNFVTENCSTGDGILIGTDTNCSEKSTPRRIRLYKDFCEKLDLFKAGSTLPTFHHNNSVSESNIDTFLISRNVMSMLGSVLVKCTLDEPLNFSCHDLLLSSLSLPAARQEQGTTYADTYTKNMISKVVWDKSDIAQYQGHAGCLLSLAESSFPDSECIPIKCELYSKLLVNAALSTCEAKKPTSVTSANTKPKQSKNLKLAKSFYKMKYKHWNRSKDHPTYKAYVQARKALQQVERYEGCLEYISFNNRLMQAHSKDRNKV